MSDQLCMEWIRIFIEKTAGKAKKRPDIYNVSCFINEKDCDVSFLTKLLFMHVFCCNFIPP